MSPANLANGTYILRSAITDRCVGPLPDKKEDPHAQTKPIFAFAEVDDETKKWHIERDGEDYVLKAGEEPATELDNHVYSVPSEKRHENWAIEESVVEGRSLYTILTNDRSKCWVVAETRNDLYPVLCKPYHGEAAGVSARAFEIIPIL